MARINNLANFLTDVASAIKTKKGDNTNILAENFDTEIMNLPNSNAAKVFSTTTEMNNDPNPKLDGLAVVCNTVLENLTATVEFTACTFPTTVTLPSEIPVNYDTECEFERLDGQYFAGKAELTRNFFTFRSYGSTSYSIGYSSSDGINYTRTDHSDFKPDFETFVKCKTPENWDSNMGYFMQIDKDIFGGLYRYKVNQYYLIS